MKAAAVAVALAFGLELLRLAPAGVMERQVLRAWGLGVALRAAALLVAAIARATAAAASVEWIEAWLNV